MRLRGLNEVLTMLLGRSLLFLFYTWEQWYLTWVSVKICSRSESVHLNPTLGLFSHPLLYFSSCLIWLFPTHVIPFFQNVLVYLSHQVDILGRLLKPTLNSESWIHKAFFDSSSWKWGTQYSLSTSFIIYGLVSWLLMVLSPWLDL